MIEYLYKLYQLRSNEMSSISRHVLRCNEGVGVLYLVIKMKKTIVIYIGECNFTVRCLDRDGQDKAICPTGRVAWKNL